jgi:hypothetical protein
MAEAAGVITLGSDPELQGRDWVTLNPTYRSSQWKALKSQDSSESPTKQLKVPSSFAPLVRFLIDCYKEGRIKVPRSFACDHLLRTHPGLFKKYGYDSWRDYAAAAEYAGHVKLTGGQVGGGDTYIALDPKWRSKV